MRAICPGGRNAGSHPRRLRRSISSFARAKDRQAPLLRQKTRRRPPRLAFLRKQSQTHPAGCAAGLAAISHASPPCLRHRLRGGTCCNFACRPALPQAQIARRLLAPCAYFSLRLGNGPHLKRIFAARRVLHPSQTAQNICAKCAAAGPACNIPSPTSFQAAHA